MWSSMDGGRSGMVRHTPEEEILLVIGDSLGLVFPYCLGSDPSTEDTYFNLLRSVCEYVQISCWAARSTWCRRLLRLYLGRAVANRRRDPQTDCDQVADRP